MVRVTSSSRWTNQPKPKKNNSSFSQINKSFQVIKEYEHHSFIG